MRPLSASPGGRRRCPWSRDTGSRKSAYSRELSGLPCRTPRSMWTGCVTLCAVTMRSLAHVWRKDKRSRDLRGQGEVAQDEVDCAVRGGVGGLAGVEGEDLVRPPPLQMRLRHEQGGGIGAGEGPLLPVADHAASREHLCDWLGDVAREQLHVQLAQGYGPVVPQPGGARALGAEPDVCIPPVHRRWGAAEDGQVGADKEPLHGRREGLDEAGFHVVGARGLAVGLVQRGPQVLHGVLQAPSVTRGTWRLRTAWRPRRSTRRLLYSSRQKARTANITSWACVRSVSVLGTCTS